MRLSTAEQNGATRRHVDFQGGAQGGNIETG